MKGDLIVNKEYISPEFSIVVSLSEYCKGLTLPIFDESGYTQIETEDPFGDE